MLQSSDAHPGLHRTQYSFRARSAEFGRFPSRQHFGHGSDPAQKGVYPQFGREPPKPPWPIARGASEMQRAV